MQRPSSVPVVVEGDDIPDVYAEGIWFATSPNGSVVTLLLGVPPQPDTTTAPVIRIVGRVRLPHQTALELARMISEQVGVMPAEQTGGPKH